MRRSQWPHPGVRHHSRWLDLGLAALLGAILIGQAVELTSPSSLPPGPAPPRAEFQTRSAARPTSGIRVLACWDARSNATIRRGSPITVGGSPRPFAIGAAVQSRSSGGVACGSPQFKAVRQQRRTGPVVAGQRRVRHEYSRENSSATTACGRRSISPPNEEAAHKGRLSTVNAKLPL